MRTKWLAVVALVAIISSCVTYAQTYPPGVIVERVYAQPASSPCGAQGGESAAIAAGAFTVTAGNVVSVQQATSQSVPAPTWPTYGFQNQTPQATYQSPPSPQEKVIVVEKKKRCHWWNPFTWGCGASASATVVVDGGLPPAYRYGTYWVPNTPAYDAYYYGSYNRVFSWGHPGYSTVNYSYSFTDNYRSGPYPPVRFIPDAPRGHPSTPYNSYGGGSRSPRSRPSPPPSHGGGRPPGHRQSP